MSRLIFIFDNQLTLSELVDWTEQAMIEADFEEEHFEDLRNMVARIGLADVKVFGLSWQDCEELVTRRTGDLPIKKRQTIKNNAIQKMNRIIWVNSNYFSLGTAWLVINH